MVGERHSNVPGPSTREVSTYWDIISDACSAAPDDILQQRLSFLHEEQDQFVADDALVIPHGSFLKTGTVLNNSQRMVSSEFGGENGLTCRLDRTKLDVDPNGS